MADSHPPIQQEPPLTVRAVLITIALLLLCAVIGTFTLQNAVGVSEEAIAERCQTAEPTWDNYDEDIKAMIGAAPSAEWEGAPMAAMVEGDKLYLLFTLRPPWNNRKAALPLLVKTPTGEIPVARGETLATWCYYTVPLEGSIPPWVEVQYPHKRQRISLDAEGKWGTTNMVGRLRNYLLRRPVIPQQ